MIIKEDFKFRVLLHTVIFGYGEYYNSFKGHRVEIVPIENTEKTLEKCEESELQLIEYIDKIIAESKVNNDQEHSSS